jgi:integrase
VTLLDGRQLDFDFAGVNSVWCDIENCRFDFGWTNPDSAMHRSAVQVLRGMLATHSLPYVSRCSSYVGRMIADADATMPSRPDQVLMGHLDNWPQRYGVTTFPFIKAVLKRWTASGLPGVSSEVTRFLDSPQYFEEAGNGWYFALVANDPERGAFTEQELRSIRDGVDRAFEQGRISLPEWALVWFLIATGVRPIQIARMRMSDVIVTSGPEGTEVTLAIPLAKGENQIVRDRWKRKAPSVLAEILLRYLDLPGMRDRAPQATLFQDQSMKVSVVIASVFRRVET